MLDEIWDWITEAFEYIISFEWFFDAKDSIVELFESIGEFSFYGLFFGIASCSVILFTKQWLLDPFLARGSFVSGMIITILTFVMTFVVGYLIGKKMEDS